MRMRRKKHGAERIAACARLLVENPAKNPPASSFDVTRPLHVEIGAGKGAFACGMAASRQDINLVAIERVPDVACIALERAMSLSDTRPADNLRFIIGNAQEMSEWFGEHSIECIYLNFSDPWPKKGYAKRRLTHEDFLMSYRRLLVPGGRLVMKTDNTSLFDFSLEQFDTAGLKIIWQTRDLHRSERAAQNIMTEYEQNFSAAGVPICSVIAEF